MQWTWKLLRSSPNTLHKRFVMCINLVSDWKDADPDIPILKEAKAEYAKLQ